jgi:hypothetical protein
MKRSGAMKSRLWNVRALLVVAVVLVSSLPYASSADIYFLNDDFGLVQLHSQKPALYFPRWFTTSWADAIWGNVQDEIRPFPAVTYQLAALWGATATRPHHVMNIAFHAATALLVLGVTYTVARVSLVASVFAAVMFAVLPLHAETVAWITGRVESIPAMFFLGAFLAYAGWRRRESRSIPLYASSLGLFFCALFSKQNTIVLGPLLVLYDLVAERRPLRATWAWVAPYVPFAVLTVAYLTLRYILFGQAAREEQLTADTLGIAEIAIGKHFQRMFFGGEISRYPSGYIAALLATAGVWYIVRSRRLGPTAPTVLYFGPCWWSLCLAPLVVVGYESTRHAYIASVGWAVIAGVVFHVFWEHRPAAVRSATVAASVAVLLFYASGLQREVAAWSTRGRVSERVLGDLEREVEGTAAGTLCIVGAPPRSWAWALPFAGQPPFARTDLTQRVPMIWPVLLDCCQGTWMERTQGVVRAWLQHHGSLVLALTWDDRTGMYSRLTERDTPELRSQAAMLLEATTADDLDRAIQGMLRRLP